MHCGRGIGLLAWRIACHGENLPLGKSGFDTPVSLSNPICFRNDAMHVLF